MKDGIGKQIYPIKIEEHFVLGNIIVKLSGKSKKYFYATSELLDSDSQMGCLGNEYLGVAWRQGIL